MLPYKPKIERRVVIPSTLFIRDNEPIKTFKIGLLARCFSIFRVEKVIIYQLDKEYQNAVFLKNILEYAETPQYLRKYLFPMKKFFKYVGVLPPLRTLHHSKIDEFKKINYREGVILKHLDDKKHLVYIGEKEPIVAFGKSKGKKRVTVKIIKKGIGRIVDKKSIPFYWGYKVLLIDDIFEALKNKGQTLKVGTSRFGEDIRVIMLDFQKMLHDKKYNSIEFYFGSHDKGLREIIGGKNPLSFFDIFVNLVPLQGTKTIRTEEAIPIALSLFNILIE